MSTDHRTLYFADENQTAAFARSLAPVLRGGDTVLLRGEIGAGKTFFARAFIRAVLGEDTEVPSPTFTLVQSYGTGDTEIWHCDLYRLTDPDEVLELGLDAAMATAICLIEWPDKLGSLTPKDALTLHFFAGKTGHHVEICCSDNWMRRLEQAHVV